LRDRLYLLHISDAIGRIREYTHQGKDAFAPSHLLQDAVISTLEVIGEVAKGLSAETRARASQLPWRQVARHA
jgi:uncharacterized protein with HEPN domain